MQSLCMPNGPLVEFVRSLQAAPAGRRRRAGGRTDTVPSLPRWSLMRDWSGLDSAVHAADCCAGNEEGGPDPDVSRLCSSRRLILIHRQRGCSVCNAYTVASAAGIVENTTYSCTVY